MLGNFFLQTECVFAPVVSYYKKLTKGVQSYTGVRVLA